MRISSLLVILTAVAIVSSVSARNLQIYKTNNNLVEIPLTEIDSIKFTPNNVLLTDNFSAGLSKWSFVGDNNYTWNATNNRLALTANCTRCSGCAASVESFSISDFTLEAKVSFPSGGGAYQQADIGFFLYDATNDTLSYASFSIRNEAGVKKWEIASDSLFASLFTWRKQGSYNWIANTQYILRIEKISNQWKFYINNVLIDTLTKQFPFTSFRIRIHGYETNADFDDVILTGN